MKKRVRAIIIKDGAILLIHRIKNGKEYWVFPGGGLDPTDKTEHEGLQRESLEELGVSVNVGNLFHDLTAPIGDEVQQELFYYCEIVSGELGTGTGPEFQVGTSYEGLYSIEWVSLKEIQSMDVVPHVVRDLLVQEVSDEINCVKRS